MMTWCLKGGEQASQGLGRARANQGECRTLRRTFRLEAILSRYKPARSRVEGQEVGEVRSRTDGEGDVGETEGLDCARGWL